MRRAAAVDKNQPEIVKALRRSGAAVIITSQLKNAFDILVVFEGMTYIVEIKDGSLVPSRQKLTDGEQKCKDTIERAGGIYHVVHSIDEALSMIGA